MLKQSKQQKIDDTLDEEFSDTDVLDDANSMFMVRPNKRELQQLHVCSYRAIFGLVYDCKHTFQTSETSLGSCSQNPPKWFVDLFL